MNPKLLRILNNREEKYPHALEQQYPRVLNKILELWGSPDIDAYFVDLMVDTRGNRAGFPQAVASEIFFLSTIAQPEPQDGRNDPWNFVPDVIQQEMQRQNIQLSPQGLLKASEAGNVQVISVLLGAGVNVDSCDDRQWTPLMISAFNGNEEMATLLIKKGADVHHKDTAGYTPLHWAAFNGYTKVAQLLLSKLADVNARSNHGWTPLLQAVTRGHLAMSSILIEHGANVNAASNDGWTPLHKAAANGRIEEAKLLVSKGADAGAKYIDGTTALDLATKNKHNQIVAMLYGRK